jgi:uncharacterized protein with FMN-binding domain
MKKIIITVAIVVLIAGYVLYQHFQSPSVTPSQAPQATADITYKNGQYTGGSQDATYGNVQVEATISGGKLTNVQFLTYPQDNQHSSQVSSESMPILTQEAITAQSANVNIVSGATQTSQAFIQSLGSALAQAQ